MPSLMLVLVLARSYKCYGTLCLLHCQTQLRQTLLSQTDVALHEDDDEDDDEDELLEAAFPRLLYAHPWGIRIKSNAAVTFPVRFFDAGAPEAMGMLWGGLLWPSVSLSPCADMFILRIGDKSRIVKIEIWRNTTNEILLLQIWKIILSGQNFLGSDEICPCDPAKVQPLKKKLPEKKTQLDFFARVIRP